MTKISAVIPDELVAALKERARAEDRSLGAEVRRALTQHLISPSSVGSRSPSESRTLAQAGAGGSHPELVQWAVEARHGRGTDEEQL